MKFFIHTMTLGFTCLFQTNANAHVSPTELILTYNSEDKFVDVINSLMENSHGQILLAQDESLSKIILNIDVDQNRMVVRTAQNDSNRNYNKPVTSEERKDLSYIVHTLAKSSLAKLGTSKSSLKKAGDRIDHLHPLRFLEIIFTDEQLKADVRTIRSRSWVWNKFYDGLAESLQKESKNNNITQEHIEDFARTIEINVADIIHTIQAKNWKEFIYLLIDLVPRSGDPDRYEDY